jgi:hypothetical protein
MIGVARKLPLRLQAQLALGSLNMVLTTVER